MTYNADTTATNYGLQFTTGDGSSSNAVRNNNAGIFSMASGECVMSQVRMRRDLDNIPRASLQTSRGAVATIKNQSVEHVWNSSANVTSITLTSSVASGFAIGSYIKVWKMT